MRVPVKAVPQSPSPGKCSRPGAGSREFVKVSRTRSWRKTQAPTPATHVTSYQNIAEKHTHTLIVQPFSSVKNIWNFISGR